MLETVPGTMVSQDRIVLVLRVHSPLGNPGTPILTTESNKYKIVVSTRKARFMVPRENVMGFFPIREVRESTLELVPKDEKRW